MVYNYCMLQYQNDRMEEPTFEFKVSKNYKINFKDMTETANGQVREIRRAPESHIRARQENTTRLQDDTSVKQRKTNSYNLDKISFQWLEQNYVRKKGLRNWNWGAIINGIISEHLREISKS